MFPDVWTSGFKLMLPLQATTANTGRLVLSLPVPKTKNLHTSAPANGRETAPWANSNSMGLLVMSVYGLTYERGPPHSHTNEQAEYTVAVDVTRLLLFPWEHQQHHAQDVHLSHTFARLLAHAEQSPEETHSNKVSFLCQSFTGTQHVIPASKTLLMTVSGYFRSSQ